MCIRDSFNAPHALESYAQVFAEEEAMHHLEAFASLNGPAFYSLPVNNDTVTLEKIAVHVPELVNGLVPFHAGETLPWRLQPCM